MNQRVCCPVGRSIDFFDMDLVVDIGGPPLHPALPPPAVATPLLVRPLLNNPRPTTHIHHNSRYTRGGPHTKWHGGLAGQLPAAVAPSSVAAALTRARASPACPPTPAAAHQRCSQLCVNEGDLQLHILAGGDASTGGDSVPDDVRLTPPCLPTPPGAAPPVTRDLGGGGLVPTPAALLSGRHHHLHGAPCARGLLHL